MKNKILHHCCILKCTECTIKPLRDGSEIQDNGHLVSAKYRAIGAHRMFYVPKRFFSYYKSNIKSKQNKYQITNNRKIILKKYF